MTVIAQAQCGIGATLTAALIGRNRALVANGRVVNRARRLASEAPHNGSFESTEE